MSSDPSENELYKNQAVNSPKVITSDDVIVDRFDSEGNTKTVLRIENAEGTPPKPVNVQYPVPTDGDSLYAKDVWVDESDVTGWIDLDGSGDPRAWIPFNNLHTAIQYTGTDNPKRLFIHFNRTVSLFQVGLGCADHPGESFSNVKVSLLGSADIVRGVIDESANATKYQSRNYEFAPELCNAIELEFHTPDTVTITNFTIQKVTNVAARLQAIKPDDTVTDIGATQGGNLKTSMEEFENTFYTDPLPVTDPFLMIARGLRVGMSGVNKYGLARNGIQTTPTDIWDRADSAALQKIWLAPTSARIHTIVSDDPADDGTPEGAGAGAQAVEVYYLPDWDTPEAVEIVILNGVAGVPMQNAAVIIHRMRVVPVGTTYNINVGNITATAAAPDSTVTAQITAGEGSTLMAIYGIPSTQTAYMQNRVVNAHTAVNPATPVEVDFVLLINNYPHLNTTAFVNHGNTGIRTTGTTSPVREYSPPKKIVGPAIIKFQAVASSADIEGTAEFDLTLVDNV